MAGSKKQGCGIDRSGGARLWQPAPSCPVSKDIAGDRGQDEEDRREGLHANDKPMISARLAQFLESCETTEACEGDRRHEGGIRAPAPPQQELLDETPKHQFFDYRRTHYRDQYESDLIEERRVPRELFDQRMSLDRSKRELAKQLIYQ
jgi:hypothetical protein